MMAQVWQFIDELHPVVGLALVVYLFLMVTGPRRRA